MSSENPYRPPDTPGKLVDEPVDVFGPRTYQRLIGQSRSAVLVLAVLAGGASLLHFVQFLLGLRVVIDVVGADFRLSFLLTRYGLGTFWKLVSGFIFLWLTLSLAAVARTMLYVSRARSTNLARLLFAENRFWWSAAFGLVIYALGTAALASYRYDLLPR